MRKLLTSLFLVSSFMIGNAQPKEVTLVAVGEGTTREEATQNALRNAVEQTFGVFVSSDIEVLNDDVIRDEIATVSSGNIKSFKEMAYIDNPSGVKMITLETTVSIGKLISYSQAHQFSIELAGAAIAANMKLYELNERSTVLALENLYKQLVQLVPNMYNYVLKEVTPTERYKRYGFDYVVFDLDVDVVTNENTFSVGEYFLHSIEALSLTREEIEPYLKMGYMGTAVYLKHFEGKDLKPGKSNQRYGASLINKKDKKSKLVYLYAPISFDIFQNIFSSAVFNLEAKDNLSNCYEVRIPDRFGDDRRFAFDNIRGNYNNYYSYCLLSPPFTGVYKVRPRAEGYITYITPEQEETGLNQAFRNVSSIKIPNNCIANTVIGFSHFNPGDIIYSFKGRFSVPNECVDKLTEFSLQPRYEPISDLSQFLIIERHRN